MVFTYSVGFFRQKNGKPPMRTAITVVSAYQKTSTSTMVLYAEILQLALRIITLKYFLN